MTIKHFLVPVAVVLLVATGLRCSGITAYTFIHHGGDSPISQPEQTDDEPGPNRVDEEELPADKVVSLGKLGPIVVAQVLPGEWTVVQVLVRDGEVHLYLQHHEHGELVLYVREPAVGHPQGPFSTPHLDIGYRTSDIDFSHFSAAGTAVSAALGHAEDSLEDMIRASD